MNIQMLENKPSKENNSKPFVIWFSGLSGSGKSTLARELSLAFQKRNRGNYILDGDELRSSLNKDLGFSYDDRYENIRRASEVAKIMINAGIIVLVAAITPLEEYRKLVKDILNNNVIQVYVKSTLEQCIKRDPKLLYSKALNGEVKDFTAISSKFEQPSSPDLILDTNNNDIKSCVNNIIDYLIKNKII